MVQASGFPYHWLYRQNHRCVKPAGKDLYWKRAPLLWKSFEAIGRGVLFLLYLLCRYIAIFRFGLVSSAATAVVFV